MAMQDTIVAPASGMSRAAISVIRLSGPEAFSIIHQCFKSRHKLDAPPNYMRHGWLHAGEETIDEVMACGYVAPASYTGENLVEIYCHGNPLIVSQTLQLLSDLGARAALPGEFTERAYLNGKINLLQAEAVADLIAAESTQAHRNALRQFRGGIDRQLLILKESLIDLAALLELELDFSEEDVEFAGRTTLIKTLKDLKSECDRMSQTFRAGNAIRNGIPVVIAGPPNAGKSTLLNALLNEQRAIVSDIPGTTRDIIQERLFLGGYEFRFIDTAGLRESSDPIEMEGIRRTREQMRGAGVILCVFDASKQTASELRHLIADDLFLEDTEQILVANKVDLLNEKTLSNLEPKVIRISAEYKEGIDQIESLLIEHARRLHGQNDTLVTNARHVSALNRCSLACVQALGTLQENRSPEMTAFEIRVALEAIGELTGEVRSDDVLGHIFSKFCIGK